MVQDAGGQEILKKGSTVYKSQQTNTGKSDAGERFYNGKNRMIYRIIFVGQ